jgi:hypothetical protein
VSFIALTTITDSNVDFIFLVHIGFHYSKNYNFHIGLAYRILPINESSARDLLAATREKIRNMLVETQQFSILPVSAPELCMFEDMSAFHKI